ncbi:MAG: exodeoxyribonuclease III [Flavobacteriales bacterium]|nr:exodeoxyribonuclease III [Flavobacteriales bacterium]MCB9447746.1 exodeoxyribonuclease III [Flavobacteriales bacterium]
MNFISWNVNGIRAVIKKDFFPVLEGFNADVLMLQETKAQDDQVREALFGMIDGYELFVTSAEKKGYSGTAILTRHQPLSVKYGIGDTEHDQEGRVITLEFDSYFVVNVYVPNGSAELKRIPYRQKWDVAFLAYLKNLEASKPVIIGGDFNVAHQPIDLARPKDNYNKTAGYTQVEIDGFEQFMQSGWVDSFRALHPEEIKYSFWNIRFGARARNVGWRIDYFLVSSMLKSRITEAEILNDVHGSDHCPVSLTLED